MNRDVTVEGDSRGRGRAISPIIGIGLLIVIVIALAVVTSGLFLSMGSHLSEPAPIFAKQGHVSLGIDNGSVASQDLVLVHQGGDPVETENARIQIDTGSGQVTTHPPDAGAVADGTWSVGEPLPIPLNTSEVCQGGDSLQGDIVYEGESSATVGSMSVPVAEGGFTIQNGAVVPVTDYTAEAKVLGTGLTYGVGGPKIDIRLDFRIGNGSYDPLPGNVNNNGNPRRHTFSDLPAGAGIAVAATRHEPDSFPISTVTRWSNESNGWVYVLRDGDTPPNMEGFGNQTSAASYVSPYLDGNDKIDLADNQAIYLFELGTSQTSDSADFQNVVVLVSLTTQQQQTRVTQQTSRRSVVVCPSNASS